MQKIRLPKNLTWDLTPLFKGDNGPAIKRELAATERAVKRFVKNWKNRSDYLKNPKILRRALDGYEQLWRDYGTYGKAFYYIWLRTQQDQANPKLKASYNLVLNQVEKLWNELQFFVLRLGKINNKQQKKFLKSQYLLPHRYFIEHIFKTARYRLTEPEEKIMTLKSGPAHDNWERMTSEFHSKEERRVLTEDGKWATKSFAEITALMNSKKKQVRDSAAKAFNEILKKHIFTAEHEFNSVLQNKKTDDELRGYQRPDLSHYVADDIEPKIVDTLVDVIKGHFEISRRYYKLKAALLGVKKLAYHERNVEYGSTSAKYSFKDAVELIGRVMSNLDRKFYEIFSEFVEKRRVDVRPQKGKSGGAFCAYNLINHPVYILLNYTARLDDVSTFAHELGHGINDELMRKVENSLYFGTSTATAEVASTFFEDFVLQELMKKADDGLRLSLMVSKLGDDVTTIFRQGASVHLERELHKTFRQKGYLSKDEIGKIFQKHMAAYMGPYVERSPGSENWWSYWMHLRRFFYNYSYASGLLISKALQRKVRENPAFIKKVKEFLAAGSSDSPKNIFKKLGIDITKRKFWEEGIAEVEKLLLETEKLARKLNKI